MLVSREQVRMMQLRLNNLGDGHLVVDGIIGPRTRKALMAFKKRVGLYNPTYVGDEVWGALFPKVKQTFDMPWLEEAKKHLGWHERGNHKALKSWLMSDSYSVGDPALYPWCGDFVETCIRLTLPEESIPENPYLALNWVKWGQTCVPQLGAVLSFWRVSPSSWKGHVGFCYGEDNEAYHVLGGNQSDKVSVKRVLKSRLRKDGCRWPKSMGPPPGSIRRGAKPSADHRLPSVGKEV